MCSLGSSIAETVTKADRNDAQIVVAHIYSDAALIWYMYAFLLGNENEITAKSH